MKSGAKNALGLVLVAVVIIGAVAARHLKKDAETECLNYAEAMGSKLPSIIEFGGGSCPPCKTMASIISELHAQYKGKLAVGFLDTKEEPDIARAHDVQTIPVQIFFDAGGMELFRHTGVFAKEDIVAKWKELGVDLDEVK